METEMSPRKPSFGAHALRLKSGAKKFGLIGLACASLIGLGVSFAGPASADPTSTYVAVGSDTIQDIMNQIANHDAPAGQLASYNAVNPGDPTHPHDVINPKDGCSMTRPNGSTEGVNALRKSINPASTTPQLTLPPAANCVDIARSSSAPSAFGTQNNEGLLTFIPFALDAVGLSTGPTSGTGATLITHANDFSEGTAATPGDLINLYKNCSNITVDGVTYNPNTATGTQVQINLYVPQAGSGTRNFWASTLGFNSTTLPTCVHDTIVAGPDTGQQVEEHDGTAVSTDPNGVGPFSIAQWISQRNGHNDRRHGAVLDNLKATVGGTSISPFSNGNPTTGTLNTAFPITRDVYNVVDTKRITSPADPGLDPADPNTFDSNLKALLVGTTSTVCSQTVDIKAFGFATISNCGAAGTAQRILPTYSAL
jgi:hypothetical protein